MSSLGVTPSRLGVSEAGVGCFVCNSSWRALGPWAGCASLVMKFDSLWLVSYICFAQHRPYTVVYRDVSIHHLVQKSEREETWYVWVKDYIYAMCKGVAQVM